MKKIFILMFGVLWLIGCAGFVSVSTNLPLNASKITIINNTNCNLSLLIDGRLKNGTISPAGVRTYGFWVGGGTNSSQMRISVSIIDFAKNRSWSDVINLSSYYKYSYVFTVREQGGHFVVEVRY